MFFNGSADRRADDQPHRHRRRRATSSCSRSARRSRGDPRPGRPDERRRVVQRRRRGRAAQGHDGRRRDRPDRLRPRHRVGDRADAAPPTTRSAARRPISAGDPTAPTPSTPSVQWDGFATDTFDGLGTHAATAAGDRRAPTVATRPRRAERPPSRRTRSLAVTFSEPVNVDRHVRSRSTCTVSGATPPTVSGGPTTFTLDPATDFVVGEELHAARRSAPAVTDQDVNDPPDTMAAERRRPRSPPRRRSVRRRRSRRSRRSRAAAPAAAITGAVTTQGVVVGDYEGAVARRCAASTSRTPPATATPPRPTASSSSTATTTTRRTSATSSRVTGTAAEFQDQTQITATSVDVCGTGATVAPTDVTLPVAVRDATSSAYEGMLVRLPQTLYVTEHFQLGRFGQVRAVVGRPARTSRRTSSRPGAPAAALQAPNDLNQIILDDALQARTPTRSCSAAAASRCQRLEHAARRRHRDRHRRRHDLHVGRQRGEPQRLPRAADRRARRRRPGLRSRRTRGPAAAPDGRRHAAGRRR